VPTVIPAYAGTPGTRPEDSTPILVPRTRPRYWSRGPDPGSLLVERTLRTRRGSRRTPGWHPRVGPSCSGGAGAGVPYAGWGANRAAIWVGSAPSEARWYDRSAIVALSAPHVGVPAKYRTGV